MQVCLHFSKEDVLPFMIKGLRMGKFLKIWKINENLSIHKYSNNFQIHLQMVECRNHKYLLCNGEINKTFYEETVTRELLT